MASLEWWQSLDSASRSWLIDHNGEALPPSIVTEIQVAGGDLASDAWWVGGFQPDGFYLSDDALDWIEAAANDEPV